MNQGQVYTSVDIVGTGFTIGATVSLGAGITLGSYNVISPTLITIDTLTCELTAALGTRDVTVTTPSGSGSLLGGVTVDYNLLSIDYFTRASITDTTEKNAANIIYQVLNGVNIGGCNPTNLVFWNDFYVIHPVSPTSLASASYNYKNSNNIVAWLNSPVFSNLGIYGATGKRGNPSFQLSANGVSQNDFGLTVAMNTNEAPTGNHIAIGYRNISNDRSNIQPRSVGNNSGGHILDATLTTVINLSCVGVFSINRLNSANRQYYKNGIILQDLAVASNPIQADSRIYYMAGDFGGIENENPRRHTFFAIHKGLTSAKTEVLHALINYYNSIVITGGR
jgi:hypothetical protein